LRLKALVVGFVAVGALMVAACGGGDSKPSSSSGGSSSGSAGSDGPPQVIEITALENGQQYAFDKTELRVKPGAITVKLTNRPDSQRPHTFDVKTKDGKDDLVKSDRAEPGKSQEVTFTVTEEGSYQFICLLPGHADRGQKGTLIVSRS
jgi:plastocyanin